MIAAIGMLASCSMMTEDLEPCPPASQVVRLHFKYDYNIQRADMFSAHVGEVRLFVVDDATGLVVKDTTVSNRDNADVIKRHPGNQYFAVDFHNLKPETTYRFVAMAQQRPYDETSVRPTDRFMGLFPAMNEKADKLTMTLTRDVENHVNAPSCGLDTLWMGHTTKPITVPLTEGSYTINDTISMVRDTKYLTITLRQLEEPANIHDTDFRVEITDKNGRLAWNNELLDDVTLLYTPHAQRTTEVLNVNQEVTARAAHYDISFSRLMIYEKATGTDAILKITDNNTEDVVAEIDLPSVLSQGRKAYEWCKYGAQEYLDREYDYNLDLFLKNGQWQYADVRVNILSWAYRVQNVEL